MPIKLIGGVILNEGGTFIKADYDIDVDMEDIQYSQTSGTAFDISIQKTVMQKLGLPEDIDRKQVADLLAHLQKINLNEREGAIKKSGFLEKFVAVKDFSILTTNLIAISNHPQIHQIIAWLLN